MKTFNQFLDEGVLTSIGKKKPEKKAEKAMDAGAIAKRKLARAHHAKYVSGSEDLVPDDIREGMIDVIKKGAKRHSKAVEKKKIKNRKAVPYAALAAQHEPEGQVLDEADPRLAIYQSGMTDASRVKGRVGKAVDKVKDKVKKVLGKKDKVSSHLDRYRFQSGLDNYLKSKVKKGVKETRDYGSQTAREGDNEAAAAARKRIYDRASAKDKDYMDARDIANQRNKERDKKLKVKEDKAFEYVKKQIAAKYGKDSYVSKDNPMKPPTAAQKKAAAAHRAKLAKQDHRDETEKATSGRYNDRSRSD